MSSIEWSDKLSVHIPEMDEQHKQIVQLLNEFNKAAENGNGAAIAGDVLTRLLAYMKVHLRAEEELMAEMKYPMLKSHRAAHARLVKRAIKLEEEYRNDRLIATELHNFIREWLMDHIMQVDRRYGEYYLNLLEAKSSKSNMSARGKVSLKS